MKENKEIRCGYGNVGSMEIYDELEKLRKENKKLKKKIKGLETTIKITSQHGDSTAEILEQKVTASKEQYKRILDVVPVPVLISLKRGERFFHANRRACKTFGFSHEKFLEQAVSSLYENPEDREKFLNSIEKDGKVDEFEVRMKKSDGSLFWASLFSEPITFQDEACLLTVIYDLTERKRAEAQIRTLREQLDQRKEKYLTFILAGEEYGIHISKVSEITELMPVTPLPGISNDIKGLVNLRGRVIPVVDLRLRLGLESAEYKDRTCIIIVEIKKEIENSLAGIIVDSVSDVINIRGKDIENPPVFGPFANITFISGMARSKGSVKILIDINKLLGNIGEAASCRNKPA